MSVNAMEKYGMPAVRIQNTYLTITFNHPGDDVWHNTLREAFINRMGVNNATYISKSYGPSITHMLPQGRDGVERFWDCSDDITQLTDYKNYVMRFTEFAELHYACILYDVKYDDLVAVATIEGLENQNGSPMLSSNQISECRGRAEDLMDGVVESAKKVWDKRMHGNISKFDDRVMEYVGHPSIHDGDLRTGPCANPKAQRKNKQ